MGLSLQYPCELVVLVTVNAEIGVKDSQRDFTMLMLNLAMPNFKVLRGTE